MVCLFGLGTVNLRGEGFGSYYDDGQTVKKGELLLEFDRDLALKNGYKDTIVIFYTQPGRVEKISKISAGKIVEHGQKVADVRFK